MTRTSSALKILFLFLIPIFVGCNEEDKIAIEKSASVFDIEQGKASIEQSNFRFMKAFKIKDSVAVANCYTQMAKILIDEIPTIESNDSIANYYGILMRKGIADFKINSVNIWGDSSILVEEGEFTLTGMGKEELDKGSYIVLWKPEGGNWKMFRHICKSNYPSDALLPRIILGDSTIQKKGKTRQQHDKK